MGIPSFPPYSLPFEHGTGLFLIDRRISGRLRLRSSDSEGTSPEAETFDMDAGGTVVSMPSSSCSLSSSWIKVPFHGRRMWRVCFGKEINLNGSEGLSFDRQYTSLIKPVVNAELKGSHEDSSWHSDLPPRADSGLLGDNSCDIDDKERFRRRKISEANKGKVPWNKGRKHTAETLQRIRERTKIAMQDPKVKMKLASLGHPQSKETRVKIGLGIRQGWQRRRRRLQVQEKCLFEWQNIIAEASRKGCVGEHELQWNSYMILDEQLNQEWLESIEKRKTRPKGSKRTPKSLEQRRKISLAIAAKWADQGYRERVCSALAKYHGKPNGSQREPTKSSTSKIQSQGEVSRVKKAMKFSKGTNNMITETEGVTFRKARNAPPSYTDPLSKIKLALIRQIKKQREVMENKKKDAIDRAKLLIAEAEKAAEVLELFAERSFSALASLKEARKMIAEAKRTIGSADIGELKTPNHFQTSLQTSRNASSPGNKPLNGICNLSSDQSMNKVPNFDDTLLEPTTVRQIPENAADRKMDLTKVDVSRKNDSLQFKTDGQSSKTPAKTKKKWVHGKFIEVQEH
ncbi:hypothetical protein J5N97_027430 [Dioscorea zingiberensis]|uniref:Nuclease associated modular domain-containing protein n=1 Tax=Dioscorea zingiberensis TaxID=325984 RepID=A0A9D5C4C7_9LILI|nr:hypothetical protein J5N97_027430 [Dioscorea zingiberensis]